MTEELFANAPQSTLNGAINSSTTSIVVTSATPFSTISGDQQFRLIVESEIMVVTATAGTTFTVVRGAEGSVAAAHADATVVAQVLTAAALQRLKANSQGWITALDFDFTAQGAQTLTPDGAHAIGGVPWVKVNGSHEVSAMTMSTANGLRMQPAGDGSNYNNSAWTAPGLRVALTDLIPQVSFGMQLRIWAWNSGLNAADNYDSSVLALDYTNNFNYYLQRSYNSVLRFYTDMGINGIAQGGTADSNTNNSDDVMVLNVPSFGDPTVRTRSGSIASGAWPAENTLRSRQQVNVSAVVNQFGGHVTDWYVSLYALRVNSGTSLVVDWKRLRVEYRT